MNKLLYANVDYWLRFWNMLLQLGKGWTHLKAGKTRERYVLVYTYSLTSHICIYLCLSISGNLSVSLALSMNVFYSVHK